MPGPFLSLLLVLLVVAFVVGVATAFLTVPVFWHTGDGFVPYSYDTGSDSSLGLAAGSLVHVTVGAVSFSLTYAGTLLATFYVSGASPSVQPLVPAVSLLGTLLVPAVAWSTFVAEPISVGDSPLEGWRRTAAGSHVVYASAFLLGSTGLTLSLVSIG